MKPTKHVLRACAILRATWPARFAQMTEEDLEVMRVLLGRYPGEALVLATEALALTRGELYPGDNLVALIGQEVAKQAETITTDEILDWVQDTIRRHGRTWSGGYPTDQHELAVRTAGGWTALCDASADEFGRRMRSAGERMERERKAQARGIQLDPASSLAEVAGHATQKCLPVLSPEHVPWTMPERPPRASPEEQERIRQLVADTANRLRAGRRP